MAAWQARVAIRPRLLSNLVLSNAERTLTPLSSRCCRCYVHNDGSQVWQEEQPRFNVCGVQMLEKRLWDHVFGDPALPLVQRQALLQDPHEQRKHVEQHLKQYGLWGRKATPIPCAPHDMILPPLRVNSSHGGGQSNIELHFAEIASEQMRRYGSQLRRLSNGTLPPMPTTWPRGAGWHRFCDGEWETSTGPTEDVLVFDVEVAMRYGKHAVLAVAASPSAWHLWCGKRLIEGENAAAELIPLPVCISVHSQLLIVSADRKRKLACYCWSFCEL